MAELGYKNVIELADIKLLPRSKLLLYKFDLYILLNDFKQNYQMEGGRKIPQYSIRVFDGHTDWWDKLGRPRDGFSR